MLSFSFVIVIVYLIATQISNSSSGGLPATLHLVGCLCALNFFSVFLTAHISGGPACLNHRGRLYILPQLYAVTVQCWVWGSCWSRWGSQISDHAFVLDTVSIWPLLLLHLSFVETKPCLYLSDILGGEGFLMSTHPLPHSHWQQTSVLYQCMVLELSAFLPFTNTRQGTDRFPTLSSMSNGFVLIFFQRSWIFFFLV